MTSPARTVAARRWMASLGALRRHLAAILLGLCLAPTMTPALAEDGSANECESGKAVKLRGGTFRLVNDLFTGTDQNYTNGVAITLVSRDISGRLDSKCLPPPLRLQADFIKAVNPGFWADADNPANTQNVVVRFGQSIYTPEDHTRKDLIVDDRPYAGLLYMGLAWNRRIQPQGGTYEMLDTREMTVGIIGPWSLAERSQNLVHDLRHIDRFLGWDNQLHNEAAFQVALERKFKRYVGTGAVSPGWGGDMIGSYAVRVGNIETAASVGVELRAGWNLPNDFGSYPIRPGTENRPPTAASGLRTAQPQSSRAPRPGVHAFVNFEAKGVARDFSLDGNLFRSSHHVDRHPWVAQVAAGISSQWLMQNHGARLALMRVWRTREFDGQSRDHEFGSLSLSIEF